MSGRDLVRGVAWGVIVTGLIVMVISLVAPQPYSRLPPRVAIAIETLEPAPGGAANAPVVPGPDAALAARGAPAVPAGTAPEPAAVAASAVQRPEPGAAPAAPGAAPVETASPDLGVPLSPVLPSPGAIEPAPALADAAPAMPEALPDAAPAPRVLPETETPALSAPRAGSAPLRPAAEMSTRAGAAPGEVVAPGTERLASIEPAAPPPAPPQPTKTRDIAVVVAEPPAAPEPGVPPVLLAEAAPAAPRSPAVPAALDTAPASGVAEAPAAPPAAPLVIAGTTPVAPPPEAGTAPAAVEIVPAPGLVPAEPPAAPLVIAETAPVAPPAGAAPPAAAENPPEVAELPQVEPAPADPPPVLSPTPGLNKPGSAMPGKRVSGLPGSGGGIVVGAATPAAPAPEIAPPAAPGSDRALDRFARAFANADGRPLIAMILIDEGSPPDAAALAAMDFPVTFAIDAARADAAEAMRRYRAAGQEVVAMTPLPDGAAPTDVSVAVQAYLATMTDTVAVLEAAPGSLQASRPVAAQIIAELARSGHGLIAFDSGLNPARQIASREGLPFGQVFRDIDGAGQDRAAIRRFIDQAAFRAGQEGQVILIGHVRPDTMAALMEWRLSTRAASVALAPISAVLDGR